MQETDIPLVSTSLNLSGSRVLIGNLETEIAQLENIWLKNRLETPSLAVMDKSLAGDLPSSVITVKEDGTVRVIREGLISIEDIENTL